ncbi:hypothetical protein F5146DRAFT_22648 [Armillaria mellea]|nr:hypothetical protein F5146DRAFT_22648 [Armillaria mellea]
MDNIILGLTNPTQIPISLPILAIEIGAVSRRIIITTIGIIHTTKKPTSITRIFLLFLVNLLSVYRHLLQLVPLLLLRYRRQIRLPKPSLLVPLLSHHRHLHPRQCVVSGRFIEPQGFCSSWIRTIPFSDSRLGRKLRAYRGRLVMHTSLSFFMIASSPTMFSRLILIPWNPHLVFVVPHYLL